MTTVVDLEIPADRLGIAHAFDRVSTLEFHIGGMIGDFPPLVWVSGPDQRTVRRALEADPSVEIIADLTDDPRTEREGDDWVRDRWLYRLELGSRVKLFQQLVSENEGAILEASGQDEYWSVQLLFHDRRAVSECHAMFDQYDFRVNVARVTGMSDLPSTRTPLTETQYETICKAHELGYFDVPREVTLKELAAELDISHQALSERLRRSHAALISAELSNDIAPPKIDP
ncbi:bacterio-opsin activator [Natronococcus pandeyae]|uniref:Bacterio-opsin activator n=1 Tax=Natronococcus pandeyae TaxID=2055836 RepID=A0A8J8Q7I4_9EURY|nr:helix-turn-helix domain-containing protein [Natronococcus pandeyae]TYL38715.1 bacterio-opsin activator [Natronococcus pandeyae]